MEGMQVIPILTRIWLPEPEFMRSVAFSTAGAAVVGWRPRRGQPWVVLCSRSDLARMRITPVTPLPNGDTTYDVPFPAQASIVIWPHDHSADVIGVTVTGTSFVTAFPANAMPNYSGCDSTPVGG